MSRLKGVPLADPERDRRSADDRRESPHIEAVWQCPNCGQLHFAVSPPDMCAYCHDFTTWQRLDNLDDYAE